jgi:hypothetical protein
MKDVYLNLKNLKLNHISSKWLDCIHFVAYYSIFKIKVFTKKCLLSTIEYLQMVFNIWHFYSKYWQACVGLTFESVQATHKARSPGCLTYVLTNSVSLV